VEAVAVEVMVQTSMAAVAEVEVSN